MSVNLIDERKNRNAPHPAHAEEFFGLFFHALSCIYQHDGTICRDESPVCVFAEILMARGVKNVDSISIEIETHNA